MSSPLDGIMEGLAGRWWGRLVIAALLFGFAGFMAFAFPGRGFNACQLGIATATAGLGLWFLVTGVRSRRNRDDRGLRDGG